MSNLFKGKWQVNVKQGRVNEISVVRQDNRHGIQSYGWFGPDKHLIFSGEVDEKIWKRVKTEIIRQAWLKADHFNRKEGK